MSLSEIIKSCDCSIVDVRTPAEFQGGSVSTAVNIPLNEIPNQIESLKALKQPLVLCCASGGRSGQAAQYLSSLGLECYNGGSWLDVNYYQSQQ